MNPVTAWRSEADLFTVTIIIFTITGLEVRRPRQRGRKQSAGKPGCGCGVLLSGHPQVTSPSWGAWRGCALARDAGPAWSVDTSGVSPSSPWALLFLKTPSLLIHSDLCVSKHNHAILPSNAEGVFRGVYTGSFLPRDGAAVSMVGVSFPSLFSNCRISLTQETILCVKLSLLEIETRISLTTSISRVFLLSLSFVSGLF